MQNRDRFARRWLIILAAMWIVFLVVAAVFIFVLPRGTDPQPAATDPPAVGVVDTDQQPADAPAAEATAPDADEEAEPEAEDPAADAADGAIQGFFVREQVERAQEPYDTACAECHGADLQGNPPLVGDAFLSRWDGQTVWALFDYTRTSMPPDEPGSLDDQTYADLTAFILYHNDLPEGEEELQPEREQLEGLVIDADLVGEEAAADDPDAEADPAEDPADEPAEEDAEDADDPADDPADEPTAAAVDPAATPDEDPETEVPADDDPAATADGPEPAEEPADPDAEEPAPADDDDAAAEAEDEPAPAPADDDEADEEPLAPGRGALEIEAEPANVTLNVIGPDGFMQRLSGAQTLGDLQPGRYLIAASRGHESHNVSVTVEPGETARVRVLLGELARSGDVPPLDEPEAAEPADEDAEEPDEAEPDDADAEDADDPDAAVNGYYAEDQLDSGEELYAQHCAQCHGQDLEGDAQNPALVGSDFHDRYDTVWDLFEYTRSNMPPGEEGTLEDQEYADIIAYVLAENDLPAGDEPLEPDEDRMSELEFDPEAAGGTADDANGEAENGEEQTEQAEDGEADDEPAAEADEAEGEEEAAVEPAEDDEDMLAAERGQQAYAQQCAHCHGQNLEGDVAPALGGPVFFERWGGHHVEWLYFQARVSMPPHAPGSLDDQAYTDIMVYILSEAGILEGHEEFEPRSPELERIVIAAPEPDRQAIEERVGEHRERLHGPFDDDEEPDQQPLGPSEPVDAAPAIREQTPGQPRFPTEGSGDPAPVGAGEDAENELENDSDAEEPEAPDTEGLEDDVAPAGEGAGTEAGAAGTQAGPGGGAATPDLGALRTRALGTRAAGP